MTTADEHPVKSGGELSRLDAAAALATGDPAAAFDLLPWLGTSIDADAAARRFEAWGLSTVIDENTGTSVIAASVFRALHERAGIDARFPVGNAGLLHVYGYLLSTTPTPYGLKRERWLDGELARAYGLAADAFLPWALPTGETLLARVAAAATALVERTPVRRQRVHDTEAVIAVGRAAASGPSALAYALINGGIQRLITTFPVASPAAVLDEVDAATPRLRWNAVV
ncbi:amino acid deaminase [Microbacterium sp. MRS-1]|uniref:amino acid deaminase n=1 Tax=Microbacterium sp. MRS-1 TaxID=1451261 RepID=UPI001E59F6DA|nr:amino acid deaminase [Microbacterium sp. MRS-1]